MLSKCAASFSGAQVAQRASEPQVELREPRLHTGRTSVRRMLAQERRGDG
jgi:hypothetical protein